jgi:glycerol uptake facilitator-like aquaporin
MLTPCSPHSVQSQGNSYFGIAIGLTVASAVYTVGNISGAALNPALGMMLPAIHHKSKDIWIYFLGPCLGSVFAALLYVSTQDRSHKRKFNLYMEGMYPQRFYYHRHALTAPCCR